MRLPVLSLSLLAMTSLIATAQDFSRGTELVFENPAVRSTSGGMARSFSSSVEPQELLKALSTAQRLEVFPTLGFAVAVEAQVRIDGNPYQLYFPRLPSREAPYVFAVAHAGGSAASRKYFEIPRDKFSEFASLFAGVLGTRPLAFDP